MKKLFSLRNIGLALAALLALLLLIQLIPYGGTHENPPVQSEPDWDSPETRALAKRACFDCHSNETDWSRWYESIAPASWLVQRDVDEGRQHLNFSEWDQGGKPRELDEVWEVVAQGSMPPLQYTLFHSGAKLNQAESDQLVEGFRGSLSR